MAYQEITDEIVMTINLADNPALTLYQFDFVGIKAEDNKGNSFIVEGNKVPDISIETDSSINWISATLSNTTTSPTPIIINVLDNSITNSYYKIYLRYNGYDTDNYIYVINKGFLNVVLYDKVNDDFLFVNPSILNITDYPLSKYTPIGIEAIPRSHDVYGNGKAGVISLRVLRTDDPDATLPIDDGYGHSMYFGQYNVNTSPYYTTLNSIDPSDTTCTVIGYGNLITDTTEYIISYLSGNVPAQRQLNSLFYIHCLHDTDTYYVDYSNNTDNGIPEGVFCPSPYLTDNSRNPAYYLTASPAKTTNVLSVFNGKEITQTLLNKATAQSNWKTASTITNNYTSGYSPAACCCWRYSTDGTKQGDWYLPTAAELCYLGPKYTDYYNTINTIIDVYGQDYACNYYNGLLMSCISHTSLRYVSISLNVWIYTNPKDYNCYVRAFTQI